MKLQITREDCTLLYISLEAVGGGLAPKNAVAAADNINVLYPTVSALDKGKNALRRTATRLGKEVTYKKISAESADEQIEKFSDELTAKQEELTELEVTPLDITREELAEAKIKPAHLALLRRWLLPPKE